MKVDTDKAKCGNPSDEEQINKLILAKERGFERLNKTVGKIHEKFMVMEVEIILPDGDHELLTNNHNCFV